MNKKLILPISIISIVVILVIWAFSTYNSIVTLDEAVPAQWAQVENAYKRRADLIPNLVSTVKGYAAHEQGTFEAVVEARAKATQITVDPSNLTPEKLKEYQAAQGQVGSALGKLLMITENYPELKANQNFLELQAQLEGTENRITVARKDFIEAVKLYNLELRTMPGKLVAAIVHPSAQVKETFTASPTEQEAPKVQF